MPSAMRTTTSSRCSTEPTPKITLRPASLSDHPSIAALSARAFHNDILFGQIIHPHRHTHPSHMSRYWLSRNLLAHFDPAARVIVAFAPRPGKNNATIPVGAIRWTRIAASPLDNAKSGHGFSGWWDPRRVLHFLTVWLVWVTSRTFYRNLAADPDTEDIIERSEATGLLECVWDPDKGRCPSWYIDCLAVDPAWQGKGVGRVLVEEGLMLAEKEGVSASVISADGKEDFYRKCGFETGPVARSGMGDPATNPLWGVPGGLVFFREAPGRRKTLEQEHEETERALSWLRKDVEMGWRSSWLESGAGKDLGR